jgi:hypothetical protein
MLKFSVLIEILKTVLLAKGLSFTVDLRSPLISSDIGVQSSALSDN